MYIRTLKSPLFLLQLTGVVLAVLIGIALGVLVGVLLLATYIAISKMYVGLCSLEYILIYISATVHRE